MGLLAKWEDECAGTLLGEEAKAASARLARPRRANDISLRG